MNAELALSIKNISVAYGDHEVLHDVSASVPAGEIRVILGTSGCGKTTLLKTCIGLNVPKSGSITIFGELLGELDNDDTAALLKRVGVLFQGGALLGSLTVAQNVALPLQMHTKLPHDILDEMVHNALSMVGLWDAATLLPSELSGGMRKRAALARALILDPPLLFCDEPSAGLDPVTSAGLDELLLSLRERLGITIIVVTHELFSIERIADGIIFLHKGRVLYEGDYHAARAIDTGPLADFFSRREAQTSAYSLHNATFTTGTIR